MGELIDFETLSHSNGAAPFPASPPRLRAIGLSDFLMMEFPPRRMLLAPWLPMGGLAMLFAPRGVGKTHVALEVAYTVATARASCAGMRPSRTRCSSSTARCQPAPCRSG